MRRDAARLLAVLCAGAALFAGTSSRVIAQEGAGESGVVGEPSADSTGLPGADTEGHPWRSRIDIHGYYEMRVVGGENFGTRDAWDLYGWQHVLNVEVEAQLAPNGFGPFSAISAFARAELKFDCVYSHGCGLFDSANAFGRRPRNLPARLQAGQREGDAGTQATYDRRAYYFDDETRLDGAVIGVDGVRNADLPNGQRHATSVVFGPTLVDLLGASLGADGVRGSFANPGDDAGFYVLAHERGCRAGSRALREDSLRGYGNRELLFNTTCDLDPIGRLAGRVNPFDAGEAHPVLGNFGAYALPYRPAPERRVAEDAEPWESQGLFIPNASVRDALRRDAFDSTDQHFTVGELQWNHGANQQLLKELRELYFDFETAGRRLWFRIGRQTIVWGKTELFRNQDQWNPTDVALGPLTSLEESRIPVFALRGIYSFYDVGPLQDVRLEVATVFDKFEPQDLGICGEPFTPRPACDKGLGLWQHGLTGAGVAGEQRPAKPWNDAKGLEYGARVEWRWDRYSFSLSDYYGFEDTPYPEIIFEYSRNVDPRTGRPRRGMERGDCVTGVESACLTPGNALVEHSANQQLFAFICAATVGSAPQVDPAACGLTIWNSANAPPGGGPGTGGPRTYVALWNNVVSGSDAGVDAFNGLISTDPLVQASYQGQLIAINANIRRGGIGQNIPTPLVNLNADLDDGASASPLPPQTNTFQRIFWYDDALQANLSNAQEALLGCGSHYGTQCDLQGIDLLNAEASALFQAFPWIEGTESNPHWNTTNAAVAQPGTIGFSGGALCTRFEGGGLLVLPGCLGPGLAGYDPAVDGGVLRTEDGSGAPLLHPFTGQPFRSETAALSWNLLMLATALGCDPNNNDLSKCDPLRAFAIGRCSFAQPQYCKLVDGFASLTRVTRKDRRAGGNGVYGRRQFVWGGVGSALLRYQKRNVLGFSSDFAEDLTGTSWGFEFTWQEGLNYVNNDANDGLSGVDTFNLTISAERPTFFRALNAQRTFFLSEQLFISYIRGYERGMTADGPWTVLLLVNASTGYFQDRLSLSANVVWDFRSHSGALLPEVSWRFTDRVSATLGLGVFTGGWTRRLRGINDFSANDDNLLTEFTYVENGLSPVRDLDHVYFKVRYAF